jgi:hypothetical protein
LEKTDDKSRRSLLVIGGGRENLKTDREHALTREICMMSTRQNASLTHSSTPNFPLLLSFEEDDSNHIIVPLLGHIEERGQVID